MKTHRLIKAFSDIVDKNEVIDSNMAIISDDETMITYSVSKFYDLSTSNSFNLISFMNEFKKKYSSYQMESTDDGFVMTKVISGFELNYELDLYDESLKLEVFTTRLSDETDESVKDLAKGMLEEFSAFNALLFKNNH